jgi:ParB family chromosome partitioning protein
VEYGYGLEHTAERIRQDRAEAAEHARIRVALETAGVPVTDGLPDGAAWLTSLRHDDQDLTSDTHAACPGHGATFQRWNLTEPSWYCTSPAEHGHTSRWTLPASTTTGTDTGDSRVGAAGTPPEPAPDPDRKLVITGNKAWQAAAIVRRRWLTASLFPRKSVPREAQVFLARQLLAMPDPLRAGLPTATAKPLFTELTGRDAAQWDTDCDTATASRLAVIMLGPVITAYEHALTDGDGRNTWRTGRYSRCPRRDAATYLTFLASLGYQLSAIEHAVAHAAPYTGDEPADDTVSPAVGAPGPDSPGQEPGPDNDGPVGNGEQPPGHDGHHYLDPAA